MRLPPALRHRDFNLYWFGVVFSQIGTRGTVAANLYQVYELTRSTAVTGLVGLSQGIALVVLSPLGGAFADRLDRRRLLQATQLLALLVAGTLAVLTELGRASAAEVLISVLLTTAAGTFDQPARQALIPAMVPRESLPQAFALLNPSRELAILTGPALAGLFIAVDGPGLMYAVDAATYAVLVVVLGVLRLPQPPKPQPQPPKPPPQQPPQPPQPQPQPQPQLRGSCARNRGFLSNFGEVATMVAQGAAFVRRRPTIWLMMGLDLSDTVFGAYRVVLPALALTVLHAGPTGYGLLSAAPSAGALLATVPVFRLVGRERGLGRLLLAGTAGYGLAAILLAQSRWLGLALGAGLLIGAFDGLATTIRQAAVQLETPDGMRGRVTSIYQMASRGGPALGDTNIGWFAALVGPAAALTLGALVPIAVSFIVYWRSPRIREYAPQRHDSVTSH